MKPTPQRRRTVFAPMVLLAWAFASFGLEHLQPLTLNLGATSLLVAKVGTVLGVGLWLWTFVELWRHETTLDPARPATSLVTSGPFRVSRNPAYLGLMTAVTGMVLRNDVVWGLILLPTALFALDHWTIPGEEADLEHAFGEDYRQYQQTVRRWLGRKRGDTS